MFDPEDINIVGRGTRAKARMREIFSNPACADMYLSSLLENLVAAKKTELLGVMEILIFLIDEFDVWDSAYGYSCEDVDEEEEIFGDDIQFELPVEVRERLRVISSHEEATAERELAELTEIDSGDKVRKAVKRVLGDVFAEEQFKLTLVSRLFDILENPEDVCELQVASELLSRVIEVTKLPSEDAEIALCLARRAIGKCKDPTSIRHLKVAIRICSSRIEEDD